METDHCRDESAAKDVMLLRHSGREADTEEVQNLHGECTEELVEGQAAAGSSCPEGGCRRALCLLAHLCILTFTPSIHQCTGPLRFFIQHSPLFLNQPDSPADRKLLWLADAFAVSGSTGLLAGLALSTLFAPRLHPKILGLLCVAAAACGLLICVTAESTVTLLLGLFFLGLTCCTTNAVLPIVACFQNPAFIFTTVCATDFASVIPLQVLQLLAEYYALDLCQVVRGYAVTVFPLLFLLVVVCIPRRSIPVAGADYYEPLHATEHQKKNVKAQGPRNIKEKMFRGSGLQTRQDKREIYEELTARKQNPASIQETPALWDLPLKEQLLSVDIYCISLWWFAISMGVEPFRLYLEESVRVQAGDDAHPAKTAGARTLVLKTSEWAAPFLVFVLPTVYCMYSLQLRLGIRKSSLQMTPHGIGLFASITMAVAGLLFASQRPVLCATGALVGNVVQALAPTAMFVMLTNAYGLKRLSLFQTIEIILLASAGFLMPLFRRWLIEDAMFSTSRLPQVLLASAVASFLSLISPRCIGSRHVGSSAIYVLATGIPLAVEKSSMVAVFAQAGFPCVDTDIPAKESPGRETKQNEEERRALLASDEAFVEQC